MSATTYNPTVPPLEESEESEESESEEADGSGSGDSESDADLVQDEDGEIINLKSMKIPDPHSMVREDEKIYEQMKEMY